IEDNHLGPGAYGETRSGRLGNSLCPLPGFPLHILRSFVANRPQGWQDPAPLKTLLFILVPLSSEEEPRAALGYLSPGKPAGRPGPRVPGGVAGAAQDSGSPSCYSQGPRLVFNRVNGRRPLTTSPSLEGTQETYTLAHEENVRFVSEAWQQVEQQLDGGPAGESGPKPVQYVERTPDPRLQNFVPIDLDEWWAQQFLARITNCS
ncbi:MAPK regulated corepressor interacting protein 2, partial [Fukomys damarensis]|uniref:MAPK regulated corepressor interacting protein 2 n=1 Tax=Fukomys damarensis TaxID=885580 RepID=UPI00053FF683